MSHKKPTSPTPVTATRHADKRANIPTEELRDFVADEEKAPKTILYPRDPSLDPQLVWKGKDEQDRHPLEVPAVPIYIQEKISPQAIIENVRTQAKKEQPEQQLALFDDFNHIPFEELVDFYHHEQNWTNRMILGDSLLVMTSLAEKEALKGKVQMIYMDPPYGIKFGSNWQVSTRKRDVKDGKEEDLTRQPEQIKAFRDTWELGIHSYLAYLRDRLTIARELLTESGSIFVQIGDENVHLVRCVLDEVFGSENFVSQITYQKTTGAGSPSGLSTLASVTDILLWYARNKESVKYRQLYRGKTFGEEGATGYTNVEIPNGTRRSLTNSESENLTRLPDGARLFARSDTKSPSGVDKTRYSVVFQGVSFIPHPSVWKTHEIGMRRLIASNRIISSGSGLNYVRFIDDFPVTPMHNVWTDATSGFLSDKIYVVQTNLKVAERCMLMTTDPGDLVLDPTCARKGTRVWVAPQPPRARGARGGELAQRGVSERGHVGGELTAIENISTGDYVLAHDGQPHRVQRVITKHYRGQMIGIRHALSQETLWLTPDHRVLCKPRPRSLGGKNNWSGISPAGHELARTLRRDATPSERHLWEALRGSQLGVKFRRQHPIGPYIADFYSREAHLVVEVDGAVHAAPSAQAHDHQRDSYLRSLGLDILRVSTQDVEQNLPGVCLAIQDQIELRTRLVEGAQWMQAGSLLPGDVIYTGPQRHGVEIQAIVCQDVDEHVYDLEIEGAHSFITDVCVVHNCGSGTTAYVAEQWGRRWITIDTSRVAIALARTRLIAGRYPYYLLSDSPEGQAKEAELNAQLPPSPLPPTAGDIKKGFVYKRVPHITLKSIANNEEIDAIHEKWQPQLEALREQINQARSPRPSGEGPGVRDWQEWEIPRLPSEYQSEKERAVTQKSLQALGISPDSTAWKKIEEWWALRRQRQQEIDASIARHADTELLYDQPCEDNKRIRVSGPFTVESLSPHRVLSIDEERPKTEQEGQNQPAASGGFETLILDNLRAAGVENTKKGERLKFTRLEPYAGVWLQATGEYEEKSPSPQPSPERRGGKTKRVAVCIGPEHGTVSPDLIKDAAKEAVQGVGFDLLVVLGFAFDPHVSEEIRRYGKLTVLPARINPDLQMGNLLLKKSGAGNLFMVFGEPDVDVKTLPDGQLTVTIKGVDIYDPTTGEIRTSSTDDIACWFIDTDYNGESFFVRHAYFTGADQPYDKLKRALRAEVDESAWSALYSTTSYPFEKPSTGKIAVKVINHYGDEVLKVFPII